MVALPSAAEPATLGDRLGSSRLLAKPLRQVSELLSAFEIP